MCCFKLTTWKGKVCTHSVEKWKILSLRKNTSWNQLFGNLFSKSVAFTKLTLTDFWKQLYWHQFDEKLEVKLIFHEIFFWWEKNSLSGHKVQNWAFEIEGFGPLKVSKLISRKILLVKKFSNCAKHLRKIVACCQHTVWIFQTFSAPQILRAIRVVEYGDSKIATLTHLEPLNFDFYAFLLFVKAEVDKK